MANVLSALEKASDEEIRNQVAKLEVVTIKNIMGTEGMKMADMAAGAVNTMGRFFGRKKQLIKDLKPRTIDEQVGDSREEHACDSRKELDLKLRQLLVKRLKLQDDASDERIAKELVNRAAKRFGIGETLAPAEKADAVFQRYMGRLGKDGQGEIPNLGVADKTIDWTTLAMFDGWQYIKGESKVEGEIYCQLIFAARYAHGRRFAPEDDDLPEWLIGRNEETRRQIEESDASYQDREEELKIARTAREEAKRKLCEAQRSEEAAREDLEKQKKRVTYMQARVEGYDGTRQGLEIELGVLEGELLVAVDADKKSTLTITKLKRAIINQREKIDNLEKEHEANLAALAGAPQREMELRDLIRQAEAETKRELATAQEAEQVYAESRSARDDERCRRAQRLERGINEWMEGEYGGKAYEIDDVFLNQLAMSNNENNKAVLKAMKQVLDADVPQDLGEKVSEGSLRLPIGSTGMFLVYEADAEGKVCFLKFTDGDSLAELQREREENL